MVAASLLVYLRRTAEFAEHRHHRVLQQAANLQILEQRRDAGVKGRQQTGPSNAGKCCRGCPSSARFPCWPEPRKRPLHSNGEPTAATGQTNAGRSNRAPPPAGDQFKRLRHLARRQDVERLLLLVGKLDVLFAQRVDSFEQVPAVVHSLRAVSGSNAIHLEVRLVRVLFNVPGVVFWSPRKPACCCPAK